MGLFCLTLMTYFGIITKKTAPEHRQGGQNFIFLASACNKNTISASKEVKQQTKKKTKMNQEQEFSELVHRHKSTIYTVCYMFSKDNDEVQDLFQDILANLWTGFGSFRGESQQKTWVWRVALNTCISVERKKKRRQQAGQLSMDIDLYADDDNDTLQVQALHKRINSLGLVDRAIILLWLEDMSYDEIGAIMGITSKHVGVKLFRIKERLKQIKDK